MSMSTSVVGIRPADARFMAMFQIYENCEKAKVSIPKEVEEFFNGERPDEAGVVIDLTDKKYKGAVKEWSDDGSQGYEVDLSKLPKDITRLRFYNSW